MPKTPKTIPADQLITRLHEAFIALRLPVMAEQLKREVDEGPPEGDSRLGFLWRLVEPQWHRRQERTVERRIDEAAFPARKSLDGFDFAFQPKLDKDRVLELATLNFIRRGQNLILGGMSGTGKSHIAIALGHLACAAGFRTRYTTSADMLAKLHAALATGSLHEALKPYVRPDLLIIDEIGLDRAEKEQVADAQLFYKVIKPRYEEPRSMIITSNIQWDAWGSYLGDDLATVAILDRLIHQGYLITIDGPSYRAAEHSKLNARPAHGPATRPTEG